MPLVFPERIQGVRWSGPKPINDDGIREETMVDVARDWYRNDKTAAEEWIASSGLSEEAVESITTRRDYGRGGRGR